MSTQPRNPRHFPTMKVRGSRRRRIAGIQRMAGAFDRFGMTAARAANHMALLVKAIGQKETT